MESGSPEPGREPEDSTNPTERAALVREGEVWTIEFGGVVQHVRGLRGLAYLSRLLARPGYAIDARAIEGRDDSSAASAERARVNVTRAIQAAISHLGPIHPSLAAHLRATVRTGKACVYLPDPRIPIRWSTRA